MEIPSSFTNKDDFTTSYMAYRYEQDVHMVEQKTTKTSSLFKRRNNYWTSLKKVFVLVIGSGFLLICVQQLKTSESMRSFMTTKQTQKVVLTKQNDLQTYTMNKNINFNSNSNNNNNNNNKEVHHEVVQFKPLVISGPSGVGKGTLINKLIDYYNHKVDEAVESHEFQTTSTSTSSTPIMHELFGFSVSHTTRSPRPGEINGIHYHFSTRQEMETQIENNQFLEYADVHGNLYGTSYESIQNVISSERICILDIDVQGAKRVKEDGSSSSSRLPKKPYFVFIAPPSIELLEERLRGRGTETEEAIQRRIGNARKEIEYGTTQGNFDEVIVNGDLEEAFLHLRQILEEWYPHLNQIPSPSYEF